MYSKVPNSVLVAILDHLKHKVMEMQLPKVSVYNCRTVTCNYLLIFITRCLATVNEMNRMKKK